MDFTQLRSLLQFKQKELSEMLKISKNLSYTQAQINILIGQSLIFENSSTKIKLYLEILDLIESIEIRGLFKPQSQVYLQEFTEEYYKTLKSLYENPQTQKIKEIVSKKFNTHIQDLAEKHINEFIKTYKSQEKSRSELILLG